MDIRVVSIRYLVISLWELTKPPLIVQSRAFPLYGLCLAMMVLYSLKHSPIHVIWSWGNDFGLFAYPGQQGGELSLLSLVRFTVYTHCCSQICPECTLCLHMQGICASTYTGMVSCCLSYLGLVLIVLGCPSRTSILNRLTCVRDCTFR